MTQLGGSSLINGDFHIHLCEIARIVRCDKIHVYIDSERESSESEMSRSRIDFLRVCTTHGVNAKASQRRATENYLASETIKSVLGDNYTELEHYQLLKSAKKPWSKVDNWKIVRAMDFDQIKDTDLGEFLTNLP